jgi:hypothetical protein
MKNIPVEELSLFVKEAERLVSKSFYQHFKSGEDIAFSGSGAVPENIPTVEQLESYVLHFRKFLQEKDRVSIPLVNQYFRELVGDRINLLDKWNFIYSTFEEMKNSKVLTGRVVTYVPEIPDLSLFKLFKIRTFGDLSHLDPDKKLLHEKLSSTDSLDGLYRFEYYNFLFESGEIISEMADLCAELLEDLSD